MTIIVIKPTQLNASDDFYLSFACVDDVVSPEIVVHDFNIMITSFDIQMSQHDKKIRLSDMTYERLVARLACMAAIT